jgi:hypothetical protein
MKKTTEQEVNCCFYCSQAYLSYTECNEHIDYQHPGKLHYPTPYLGACCDVLISQIIKKGV